MVFFGEAEFTISRADLPDSGNAPFPKSGAGKSDGGSGKESDGRPGNGSRDYALAPLFLGFSIFLNIIAKAG